MANIPNEIIQQIIQKNDIVDVISQYVSLEKKGRNYFGLCPFHHEKTPSFSVSPEKQIFHCFSCGEGGDVIGFVSKIENLSYPLSVKKLASRVQLNIDNYLDDNKEGNDIKYFEMNAFVSEYYQFALLHTKEGKKALDYLASRNIDLNLIKQFKIGLAPDSVNSLFLALKNNHFSEMMMLELGHVIKSNEKYYDKFKNRIMFPITDEYGNILGFSGRTYLETGSQEAKYINTQETPIFKKRNIVYHLDQAKKAIRQSNKVFFYEGFMDVIASSKSGLLHSVATMGTALTEYHIHLLKKYTNNFVLCYDGDNAGIEATKKAIELLNRHGVNSSVVTLPEGLDPDEYVNKYGKERYREYVETYQKSYKEYMYDLYFQDIDYNKITTLETFKKQVFSLLLRSTLTEKELFLQRLSNDIHVSLETLNFDFDLFNKSQFKTNLNIPSNNDIINQNQITQKVRKFKPNKNKLYKAQKIILFMCLYNRKYSNIINRDSAITIPDQTIRLFIADLEKYYQLYDSFIKQEFMENFVINDENYKKNILELLTEYEKTKMDEYNDDIFEQSIAVVNIDYIFQILTKLEIQLQKASEEQKIEIGTQIVEQRKKIDSIKKNKRW